MSKSNERTVYEVSQHQILELASLAHSIMNLDPDSPAYFTASDGTSMVGTPLCFAQRQAAQIVDAIMGITGGTMEAEDDEQ